MLHTDSSIRSYTARKYRIMVDVDDTPLVILLYASKSRVDNSVQSNGNYVVIVDIAAWRVRQTDLYETVDNRSHSLFTSDVIV